MLSETNVKRPFKRWLARVHNIIENKAKSNTGMTLIIMT